MSKGNNEAWVKIGSEAYEDCIVGNKDGLLRLKDTIDKALEEDASSPVFRSDISSVVCTEDDWEEAESSNLPAWQEVLFKFVVALWLIVLPLLGIWLLIAWLI